MRTPIAPQSGAALIVSLIMLLLITILAVTAFRLGKSNLQIMGNVQQRDQEIDADQFAIDQAVSSLQFTLTPTNAVPNPCNGVPNQVCAAAAGGTGTDITVKVDPTCDSIQPIPVTALNYADPNDAGCLVGVPQSFGVTGASSNDSMCSNSVWNVNATATDNVTGSVATVDEGAAVRVNVDTTCP